MHFHQINISLLIENDTNSLKFLYITLIFPSGTGDRKKYNLETMLLPYLRKKRILSFVLCLCVGWEALTPPSSAISNIFSRHTQ